MFSRTLTVALLALIVAGCEGSGSSGEANGIVSPLAPSTLATQTIERPYQARFVWATYAYVTAAQSGDPRFGGRCSSDSRYLETGKITGEMTHGGRFEGTGSHCVQGFPATGITYTDGIATLATANGDLLTLTYGSGTISAAEGYRLLFESTFTVTGGTGRFAEATGGGMQHGVFVGTPPPPGLPQQVLNGGSIEFEQHGMIDYAPGRVGQ
jgi:hypothetical protein